MKVRKASVSLTFRVWVLATVFVWPFLETWGIAAWAVAGAGLALWWRVLPEDPPAAPERLPYQHLYPHLAHPPPDAQPASATRPVPPPVAEAREKSL